MAVSCTANRREKGAPSPIAEKLSFALNRSQELCKDKDVRIKELEYDLGQTKIQLDHKTTLLASCEKALEERDAKHY